MMLHGIWARGSKCVAAHKDKKGQRWAVPLWFLVLFIGVLNSCAPFFLLFHYLFLFFLLVQMKDHFLPQNSKIMYVEMGWILIILFWSKTNHMTLWGCALPFTLIGSFFLRSTPWWHSWKWGTYHENTMKM